MSFSIEFESDEEFRRLVPGKWKWLLSRNAVISQWRAGDVILGNAITSLVHLGYSPDRAEEGPPQLAQVEVAMTLPLFPGFDLAEVPNQPHRCHARACQAVVPPERLMCLAHWRMVPRVIQRAVWATYRQGQCDDKRPSRDWHRAASAAIGYVARREGRPITPSEAAALAHFE